MYLQQLGTRAKMAVALPLLLNYAIAKIVLNIKQLHYITGACFVYFLILRSYLDFKGLCLYKTFICILRYLKK